MQELSCVLCTQHLLPLHNWTGGKSKYQHANTLGNIYVVKRMLLYAAVYNHTVQFAGLCGLICHYKFIDDVDLHNVKEAVRNENYADNKQDYKGVEVKWRVK